MKGGWHFGRTMLSKREPAERHVLCMLYHARQEAHACYACYALQEAMRRLAEETHKPKVQKNNFKCPKCHRVRARFARCASCTSSACLMAGWQAGWCCPPGTSCGQRYGSWSPAVYATCM